MAEKILRKFQQYSKNELMQLLQKNGYDEFVEILNNGDITTGETFLNLTELQIIKWKLPPDIKKKLMSLLQEVKQNPQNFMEKSETDKPETLTRRQSLRTKSDFKEKLEQVITIPKPTEVRKVKQPAPLPKEEPIQRTPLIAKEPEAPSPKSEKERVPSPVEEYLQMDRGKQEENVEAHYDSSGYMVPVSKLEEENYYEPAPSDRIITNFIPAVPRDVSIPITRRAPLALPRDSTDERGYIRGPEDLASPDQNSNEPPTFPRVYRNPKTGAFKPKISTPTSSPSSQLPPKIIVQKEIQNEDEDVAYEIIDGDDEKEPPSRKSPEPTNVDVQTGSLSRIIGFLKKGGRSPNYKQDDQNSNEPPTSPRVYRSPKTGAFKSKVVTPTSSPSSQLLHKIMVQEEIQNEEVAYEAIGGDDEEEPPSGRSPEPTKVDVQTGSPSRIVGFLKKGGRSPNYEQDDQNSNEPPTSPRVYRSPKTGAFKSKVVTPTSSPSSQLPLKIMVQKQIQNEDEEVAYEPIGGDDEEEPPSGRSPEPTKVDVQTGSPSRIVGFLKKGGRSPNYEQDDQNSNKSPTSTPTSSPSSQLPLKIMVQKQIQNEDEEVAYEPIGGDDEEEPPSGRSPEPTNVDVQTGSLSRIVGFLKKGGRSPNYEQNEIRVAKVQEKSDNRKPAQNKMSAFFCYK